MRDKIARRTEAEARMGHQPLPPFAATSGPRPCRILFVGEAWGGNEHETRRPFVGEAGKEFFRMIGEAWPEASPMLHSEIVELHKYGSAWVKKREKWLEAEGIGMTNVFAFRPPGNKIPALCASKREVGGKDYTLPHVAQGKYIRPEYLSELDRLWIEIESFAPTLIVAFGNVPCWALLRTTNISALRGTTCLTHSALPLSRQFKVLPTYHPAAILYNWPWRPIVVADLMKALRESAFAEIRRPARRVIINPTLGEIDEWTTETLTSASLLACDIETEAKQIKCVGFARSESEALVIPFMNLKRPGGSYWDSKEEELEAWRAVARLLESPLPKVFQNGVYDIQYLMPMGIRLANLREDTMLLQHSLFPEMQKSLGFLGSIHTSEPAWKLMRKHKASEVEKKDE